MSDLPPGWEWATLNDVAVWGSGGTPKAGRQEFYGGNIPWAVIGDLNDTVVSATRNSLTKRGLQESSAKLVPAGSVLIAMYGSIGKLGLNSIELATNQAIAFAKPLLVDARYLFFYLMSARNKLSQAGKGATQQNISQTLLRSWPIPVAPLAEQRRIVTTLEDHLSRLDAGAASLSSAASRTSDLEERAIVSACTALGVARNGRSAPPPVSAGVNDGTLPPLPTSWRWARLGEIADVVGGVTKDAKRQLEPGLREVPYLRVANVQRGRLNLSEVATIRVSEQKITDLALQPGDVLLNEGGDRDKLARGWIWQGELPLCVHQNHVFRARIRDGVLDPRILAWHANTFGKSWAQANGKQSVNLASISLKMIRLMPVPVPPSSQQASIVEAVEDQLTAAARLRSVIRADQNRADRLRRALLTEAFLGRLVSQDHTDEPASVLLDRIRAQRAAHSQPRRTRRAAAP